MDIPRRASVRRPSAPAVTVPVALGVAAALAGAWRLLTRSSRPRRTGADDPWWHYDPYSDDDD